MGISAQKQKIRLVNASLCVVFKIVYNIKDENKNNDDHDR